PLYLYSFPTRRSSDLQSADVGAEQQDAPVPPARPGQLRPLPPRLRGPTRVAGLRLLRLPDEDAALPPVGQRTLPDALHPRPAAGDRKSTRLNSSHVAI